MVVFKKTFTYDGHGPAAHVKVLLFIPTPHHRPHSLTQWVVLESDKNMPFIGLNMKQMSSYSNAQMLGQAQTQAFYFYLFIYSYPAVVGGGLVR